MVEFSAWFSSPVHVKQSAREKLYEIMLHIHNPSNIEKILQLRTHACKYQLLDVT